MALFRKFFLKKTPDRLLEISERVYGIMLATLRRAGSCGCEIRGGASCCAEDFGLPLGFGGLEFSRSASFVYMSSIELEFGAVGSTSVDNKQLDLVNFELDSGLSVCCVCGFGAVVAVLDLAAFGFSPFTPLNLMVFLEVCFLGSFGFSCICLKLACSSPPSHCAQIQLLNHVNYNGALIH